MNDPLEIADIDKHNNLRLCERAVLKAAISMLDQEQKEFYGGAGQQWAVRLTGEEGAALPGESWELLNNGQACPK
jgi:hypothetical protein